jgi:hypothetical protein
VKRALLVGAVAAGAFVLGLVTPMFAEAWAESSRSERHKARKGNE